MRLGTRGSALALAQAEGVAAALGGDVELVTVTTSGDRGVQEEDKSRWVKELELALLAGEIDLAVHSAKDVPGELPDGLAILGVPGRADPRDALCGAPSLDALPSGARVGTSSLRRAAQLRALREDLEVVELRGNVDTRLRKLADGDCDAIVLARAGLDRLGRAADSAALEADAMVPAPGQGALALEGRTGDRDARAAAERLSDAAAFACLSAERALAHALGASCHTPVGALATLHEDEIELSTWVGLPDGSTWLRDRTRAPRADPAAAGQAAGARLLGAGAADILGACAA
jgi:hydroxymethylbilane synthase